VIQRERVLRTLVLAVVVLGAFSPLVLLAGAEEGPPPIGPAGAAAFFVVLLAAALGSARSETRPEELDGFAARRARRFAPLVVGLAATGVLLFPSVAAWPFLWLLYVVNVPLALFWHVPRTRTVSLVSASVAGLGATVLAEEAAPALAFVAAGWLLVPLLDRVADARARVSGRPAAPLGALLGGALLVGLAGAGGYAGSAALLPPSDRRFEEVDLLEPRARATPDPAAPAEGDADAAGRPSAVGPIVLLLGGVLGLLVLANAWASARAGRTTPGEAVLPVAGLVTGEAGPAPPGPRSPVAWPPGPRRRVVEAYLDHAARLDAGGRPRGAGATPAAFAADVAEAAPAAAPAARRLAAAFGRARWSPAPVDDDLARAARDDAAAVEAGLEPPAPADAGPVD